jgi:hypothetical protein
VTGDNGVSYLVCSPWFAHGNALARRGQPLRLGRHRRLRWNAHLAFRSSQSSVRAWRKPRRSAKKYARSAMANVKSAVGNATATLDLLGIAPPFFRESNIGEQDLCHAREALGRPAQCHLRMPLRI